VIVVREIIGHRGELTEEYEAHEHRETLETVVVSERKRSRSRFKTELTDGTELGVILGDQVLSPGDVLVENDDRMIVVEFEHRDALVVSVPEMGWKDALGLGHHMGNQHWELALRGGDLLIPIVGERRLMKRTLREVLPEAAQIAVETVDPEIFDASETDHGHRHDHSDSHSSDHSHAHGDSE
jgi:urease accessory protein